MRQRMGDVEVRKRLAPENTTIDCRRILRALLVLCPLLGVNYALTIYQPTRPHWLSTAVAFYSLTINATQVNSGAARTC